MPTKPPTPCRNKYRGCANKAERRGYCLKCLPEVERRRNQGRVSPSKLGYGRPWQKLRAEKLRVNPWCQWPGCEDMANEVDHITPKSQGGTDDWDNLQSLCKPHHSAKTMREIHTMEDKQ